MIRHRLSRSRSHSYDSVSPRSYSRSPSRSRGKKKKSHKKRKLSSTSSSSSRRSSSSSSRERERKRHMSKRRRRNTLNHFRSNVTNMRRSTRGRGVLLHLLLFRLLQFLQTLLLLFREGQPGRSLELILGLLLRLMTILTPLLGLRVRRHTRIISVYLRIMMTNLICILRIIRTKRLILCAILDIGLWASVTPVTFSDHEHSVLRSQSVRPDTVDRWSILLNRTLLELRSELEHGSASLEPDIVLMFLVHHGGITAHILQLFPFDMLTQVNSFRLRCSGIIVSEAVLALTTLSL